MLMPKAPADVAKEGQRSWQSTGRSSLGTLGFCKCMALPGIGWDGMNNPELKLKAPHELPMKLLV